MKPGLLLLLLFSCTVERLVAQCDSTDDVSQVFTALKIDDDLSFLQSTPFVLKPELDKESITIVKDGISRHQYIRQLDGGGRIVFDTLRLTDKEQKETDSLFSVNNRKWTKSNALRCRIGRDVQMYKKTSDPPGILRTSYRLMEPIFLRDRTLALAFYKREAPDNYSEFTILIKKSGKWELWEKIIVTIGQLPFSN